MHCSKWSGTLDKELYLTTFFVSNIKTTPVKVI